MNELFQLLNGAAPTELLALAFLAFGIPFCLMAVASFVLSKIVGLQSEPDRRALLTVLPAYTGVTLLSVFGVDDASFWPLVLPLAGAPMALVIYWWWQKDFRSRWFDADEEIPLGTEIENDDWKIGLAAIVALFLAASVKVLLTRGF